MPVPPHLRPRPGRRTHAPAGALDPRDPLDRLEAALWGGLVDVVPGDADRVEICTGELRLLAGILFPDRGDAAAARLLAAGLARFGPRSPPRPMPTEAASRCTA